MNLVWSTMIPLGFAIIVFLVYNLTCWSCCVQLFKYLLQHSAKNLCMQKQKEWWMSRMLGVDTREVMCDILLRGVVKVCAIFQSLHPKWVKGKRKH